MRSRIKEIASNFNIAKSNYNFSLIKKGNINVTYCLTGKKKYILQKINDQIFKEPEKLIDNIKKVTEASKEKGLTLVNSKKGKPFFKSEKGEYWRLYHFIEGKTYNSIKDSKKGRELAFEAGKIFGKFQKRTRNIPLSKLNIVIPNFQCPFTRYDEFLEALKKDVKKRAKKCHKEIDFFLRKREIRQDYEKIAEKLPKRVVHNDTKINNVIFSTDRKAKAVIDLDVVMPDFVINDVGDLLRSSACTAKEDEKDLSKVNFSENLYREILKGYLSIGKDFLTKEEIETLPYSVRLITCNLGMRFLTDYLNGDRYFAINPKRKDHNLERSKVQKKLLEEIEKKEEKLEKIYGELCRVV